MIFCWQKRARDASALILSYYYQGLYAVFALNSVMHAQEIKQWSRARTLGVEGLPECLTVYPCMARNLHAEDLPANYANFELRMKIFSEYRAQAPSFILTLYQSQVVSAYRAIPNGILNAVSMESCGEASHSIVTMTV
jgi:glutamate/tyrosine decarboxylase-like PLP-dependent enzyme